MQELLAQGRRFFRAVHSFAVRGDVDLLTYQRRQAACEQCPAMRYGVRGLHCNVCGCPDTVISDLRTKWRMPALECPLGKW